MSDDEISELFSDTFRAQARLAAEYKHVAIEVPIGSPQIEYETRSNQWVPRGDVLRCVISGWEGQVIIEVDDHELSIEKFGRLLTTHSGWGMRIDFVREDQVHLRPAHQVREP